MIAAPTIEQRPLPDLPDRLPADLHPVLRRVLLARGIHTEDQLRLELDRLLTPDALGGIDSAAARLADAVTGDERILVVGDFDADGATGTALAVRALRAMGAAHVDFRVPNRFEFGYGLTPGLVDTLAERPPGVLVTVDSGICCNAGVARANALGCSVIVTDHHLPGEHLPEAAAIVNPNLPGDAFGSKALAGVGVMFYLVARLRAELRERGWFGAGRRAPQVAQWLDLVALGTVADLVPLDHNNRVLVEQGLSRIRARRGCEGIMALLRVAGRDYRHAVAGDLGFAVAPRLNAAGRLEDMAVGIRCLLADDPEAAGRLAGTLDGLNRERRALQDVMQDEAMSQVRALLDEIAGRETLPAGLCLFDARWHQGVVGLVASRIKDAVHRPVVAFAPDFEGSERLKGSARSIRGLHIRDVLAHVDGGHPGLMDAFGGHAMAAGLSLQRERLPDFEQAFHASVTRFLDGEEPVARLRTDGSLSPDAFCLEFAEQLRALGPWGQRFPEPLFEGRFEVLDARVVGGAHTRLELHPGGGARPVTGIAFGVLPEDLPSNSPLHCLYRLDVNHFRGRASCQLRIEHIVR